MMTSEHSFEEKGKVKPKPAQEPAAPRKENAPITADPQPERLNPATVQQLQQTVGNTAVQRFLAQRSGSGPTELDEETADTINRQRGAGQQLDEAMTTKAGSAMGHDFSDVNVHTDGQADQLSQQLGAKAFTTGNDIFFREGAYDPASSDGQQLIAHELTHVAQQGAAVPAVQGKMAVNDPNDQYEAEADQVANQVMAQPDNVQRQEEEEEMVQMQEEEEEELVQMQEEEEEELVQMQEMEEEEELQA
jgi:hypothetical protein